MSITRNNDEGEEDFAFIKDRERFYGRLDASFWFYHSTVHGVACDFYIRGAVYCTAHGETRREALEKAIAKVVLGQMEGLRLYEHER